MNSSLHTKYRPKTFDEVVGHTKIVKSLRRVVKDRRAHTFMFTGPSGTGKTTLARILAGELAGGKPTPSNIIEIDAATNSGADAMREVIQRSHYRAIGESPTKAIIIDESHRLSAAAWTVLLKATEEPPSHVYWMVCTTEAGKIPKTMETRCIRYDLRPVSEELLYSLLGKVAKAEGITLDESVLEAIAESSGGSPRQALVFLEACVYAESTADARNIMRSAGQSGEVVNLCRFLLRPQGGWAQCMRLVKSLEGIDAESIRIQIVNYLTVVLKGTNDDRKAKSLLQTLECFIAPYTSSSDKHGPLLHSLGLALNMDRS